MPISAHMNLLEGEEIILRTEAEKNLLYYRLFHEFIAGLIFVGIFLIVPSFVLVSSEIVSIGTMVVYYFLALAILLLVYMAIKTIYQTLRYNKLYLWITNKRLIIRRGLIGESQKSILLERIGEITIKQTFLQRLFGVRILLLEVIGAGGRNEVLPGFKNAVNCKQMILDLISKKRKAEKLTF